MSSAPGLLHFMKINKLSKFIIVIYIITLIFWAVFNFLSGWKSLLEGPAFNYLLTPFLVFMTVLPLIGGLIGIYNSIRWGGWKSSVGRSLLCMSLGLITWSGGMVIWNYYLFFTTISVPYPSFADVSFMLSWPLWTIGAIFLSIAAGANLGIKNLKGKVFLLIIPIIISAFSYYFLVVLARQGMVSTYDNILKTFFDLAYPIGDVVILTIAALVFGLSYKYLGGKYRIAIYFILAGFMMNYFADFTFSYTTTLGTYYNGSLSDILFVTAMALLSVGVAGFVLPDYKNKKFSIIDSNTVDNNSIFHQILVTIIKKQESVIGLSAWYEANNVSGLIIDQAHNLASFSGSGKEAIDRLVFRYEELFGKASRAVCKEAVRDLTVRMQPEEIPDSLK